MIYDTENIKQSLSINQVFDLISELGGDPILKGNYFIARTICHGGSSHKLYYYDNTKLFHCYTECVPATFDIFELIMKIGELDLTSSVKFIIKFFDLFYSIEEVKNDSLNSDWKILNRYEKNLQESTEQIVEIKTFDESILKYLPQIHILDWEKEGISPDLIKKRGIVYDPKNNGIVIPHYNIDNQLVGIRERTLIQEQENKEKYKPAILNNKMYNHPLSFNLYNLNNSKDNIKTIKKAIVFESEKSCLKYASIFGEENDISVAVCGSSLTYYQIQLLLSLDVQEVIIAFDKQFKQLNDAEHKKWCKKLIDIYNKYGNLVQISYLFDKTDILQYKDSPIDEGKEKFLQLFNGRIFL